MKKSSRKLLLFLWILPVPVALVSLCMGPSDVMKFSDSFSFLWRFIFGQGGAESTNKLMETILFDIRLPRILLAFTAGAVLAVSGSAMQAVLRNPLVSPFVLGLSSGAAFGAALALAWPVLNVQLSAFTAGFSAMLLTYLAAMRRGQVSVVSLILAGVIVGGVFTALLTIVQFVSDPFRLQTIVAWTMGNMHHAGWPSIKSIIGPVAVSMVFLWFFSWKLNVLALGDDEARSSGVNPFPARMLVLTAATLASSAIVSVTGIIGLFGLIVPHMVRMIAGPDHRISITANFLMGGTLLLIIDDFSRTMAAFEIPIGIFTMLIGAPFFVILMKKSGTIWE